MATLNCSGVSHGGAGGDDGFKNQSGANPLEGKQLKEVQGKTKTLNSLC